MCKLCPLLYPYTGYDCVLQSYNMALLTLTNDHKINVINTVTRIQLIDYPYRFFQRNKYKETLQINILD